MFGLTFEKLFLIAVVAGVVIGPQRLPVYARQLADTARSLRSFVETSRRRAEDELGVSLDRAQWDLRSYDPRHVVREALSESPSPAGDEPRWDNATTYPPEVWEQAARVRPGQKYLTSGSAAHPARLVIASLPEHDPRRIAAVGHEPSSAVP